MTNTSVLFILSFLVIFSISTNFFSSAAEAPEPVLDVAGKMLRTYLNYYILPANVFRGRYRGGGLTLSGIGNDTCPAGVFQETSQQINGIPLTFFPVNPKKGVVRVSTDLNIKFDYPDTCDESPVWSVDNYVDPSADSFVNIGGVVGNPGSETLSSWFKIQKFGYRDYKLVFCPTVCSYCDVICKDVGITYQDGKRRLSLTTDYPHRVVFQQA
nr:kunitz trypsin inhibitor 2-like [Coffea arabica]